METENKSFFLFPAEKRSIREFQEGKHIEEKDQSPNYILVDENKKIFRINIIATLVHKELRGSVTSILIDDGSGKIILRIFEENKAVFHLEVGDVVQVIGKIRVFNQEKYVFPEIIKKINPFWLKVRSLEVQRDKKQTEKEEKPAQKIEPKKSEDKKEIVKETISSKKIVQDLDHLEVISEEIEENDPLLPFEKLSKLISELDKGEGAMIEEIIERSPLEKTEELIEKMLENGDIFQNMPGKVRLL